MDVGVATVGMGPVSLTRAVSRVVATSWPLMVLVVVGRTIIRGTSLVRLVSDRVLRVRVVVGVAVMPLGHV